MPSKCLSCNGDVFPIFHGGYYVNLNGTNQFEEYPFCHVEYAHVRKVLVFSNQDLLFVYLSNVLNVDREVTDLYLNDTRILVRVDYTSAKTVWAKALVYESQKSLIKVSEVAIRDDLIYCLLTVYQLSEHVGGIAKVDENGNVISFFSFINNIDGIGADSIYFVPDLIATTGNKSCIIGMETAYYPNLFGVSSDSQLDVTLISFDSYNNFSWLISIDFLKGKEIISELIENDGTIYVSFNSEDIYLCICTLNLESVSVINSACVKSVTPYPISGAGRFKIILVSQKWIFARDRYYNSVRGMGLFIYENNNSLKLVKIIDAYVLTFAIGYAPINLANSYIFVNKLNKFYRLLKIDDSFNISSEEIEFLEGFSTNFQTDYSIIVNNSIIISTSYSYYVNDTFLNNHTLTSKLDFNFTPQTCQEYYKYESKIPYNEIPFEKDSSSSLYYTLEPSNVDIYYYNKTQNTIEYKELTNTTNIDITDCIWPRYDTFYKSCKFPIPSTILNLRYKYKIGSSDIIPKIFDLHPFDHCQNSKFIISVMDISNSLQPDWISINQKDQSVIITTESFNSTFSTNLLFSARLYTISDNVDDITTNSSTSISFINSNCNLVSFNYSYYLVLNQVKEMQFVFIDDEDDIIKIKVNTNANYGSFVKYENSSLVTIMLQSTTSQLDPVDFIFMYTDSYHQANEDWTEFSTSLYLFESEPPFFNETLNNIQANNCKDFQFTLPTVIDLNNENVTIKLKEGTPNWIQIRNNTTLEILSKSDINAPEGQTEVTIVLENHSMAWRKYSLNITIESYAFQEFSLIPDIKIDQLYGDGVLINSLITTEIKVVDCLSDHKISWLVFESSRLKLRIESLNTTLIKNTCCRLSTIDLCNSTIFSVPFYINSNKLSRPPALAHRIGPFEVPIRTYILIKIPDDMFVDFNGNETQLSATVLSCSFERNLNVGIISENDKQDNLLLYIFSDYVNNCKICLQSSDIFNQSSEQIIDIKFYSCASK